LHGLSPVLRSLYLSYTSLPDWQIFDFVCSFPLPEDLTLVSRGNGRMGGEWNTPSTSPRLTGTLELAAVSDWIQSITHRLLDLPNGIHFTAITAHWCSEQDVKSTTDLVSTCAGTLQSLEIVSNNNRLGVFPSLSARSIAYCNKGASAMPGINLSRARKLRDVLFRCRRLHAQWISKTLRTA